MESRIAQSEVSAKIYSHNLEGDLVGMFRTLSPGDSISVALRKLLQGGRMGSQATCKFAAKAAGTLKIRYGIKEFSFLCLVDTCLWAH